MGISKPDDYARELGLKFTVEEPAKSNMKVLRFTFEFPPMGPVASKPSPTEAQRAFDEPQNADYVETVKRFTLWSKKVKPWTFIVPDARPIVAAELTWGARWRVGVVNRHTKKQMKAFWSEEANARRLALSQPTPQMGINVLDATPKKEKETRQLREQLARAAVVLAGPDTPADLQPNVDASGIQ